MYMGALVEVGGADEVCDHPLHPYTQVLMSAVPQPDPVTARKQKLILPEGEVPSPIRKPSGCAFHNRCPNCMEICKQVDPALAVQNTENGHMVACHLYAEQQKKIQEEKAAAQKA